MLVPGSVNMGVVYGTARTFTHSPVSGGPWWLCGSEGLGHTLHTDCHTSHRGSVLESLHHHGCHTEAGSVEGTYNKGIYYSFITGQA